MTYNLMSHGNHVRCAIERTLKEVDVVELKTFEALLYRVKDVLEKNQV